MNKTKFEQDLKAYFPKIHSLYVLGEYDNKVWEAIYKMLEFSKKDRFGKITISYQKGKINYFEVMERIV